MKALWYNTDDALPIIPIFRGAEDADRLANCALARPEALCDEFTHNGSVARVIHVFLIQPTPLQ